MGKTCNPSSRNQLIEQLRDSFLRDKARYERGGRCFENYALNQIDIVPAFKWDEELRDKLEKDFNNGDGAELKGTAKTPPKMHAVHSSSAQCVNAFAFPAWQLRRDSVFWTRFFGFEKGFTHEFDEWSFEKQYPVLKSGGDGQKMSGTPPNLDFSIWNEREIVAIESKLIEPFDDHDQTIQSSYFYHSILKDNPKLFCLAKAIHVGVVRFSILNAAQLIKHSLGLLSTGKQFRLGYLYNERADPEGHRQEVALFTDLVSDAGVSFFATTYQDAFERLKGYKCEIDGYTAYMNWFSRHYL